MPNKTDIQWCDYSSNPIYVTRKSDDKRGWHCDKPSAGCGHCYAETLNKRFGTQLNFHKRNAELVNFHINEKELLDIIKLNDRLAKKGETAKLFLCDMTDLFLDEHPDEFIDKIFATAALCPNIIFQILTKRADRMKEYFDFEYRLQNINCAILGLPDTWFDQFIEHLPLPNVWLGVSCENQKTVDERIPLLLETPAAVRFLSCEPLLEEIDLRKYLSGIDLSIIGGESGTNARPCDIAWIRSIVEQCAVANVPAFVKQLGSNPIEVVETINGVNKYNGKFIKDRKGGDILEFPEDLQIRQMPNNRCARFRKQRANL